MKNDKSQLVEQIEEVFKDLGGFSWEQVETWASFCFAVGMDPLPQLKVMMNAVCNVICRPDQDTPAKTEMPELWVEKKGHKIRLKVIGPF